MRTCDRCGSRMPPFVPRKRDGEQMICEGCQAWNKRVAVFKKQSVLHNPTAELQGRDGDEWYHGSKHDFDEFGDHGSYHWNTLLGHHFTAEHEVAEMFSKADESGGWKENAEPSNEAPSGHLIHTKLHIKRPKTYRSEHDMDQEVYEHERARGNHIDNYYPGGDDDDDIGHRWKYRGDSGRHFDKKDKDHGQYEPWQEFHPAATGWLNAHPDKEGIARRFKERLKDQGHDGIVYGNEFEETQDRGRKHLDYWSHRPLDTPEVSEHNQNVPQASISAIAFEPHQIEVTQHHHGDDCKSPEELSIERRKDSAIPHFQTGHSQHYLPTLDNSMLLTHSAAKTAAEESTDWDHHHPGLPEEVHRGLFAPQSHGVFAYPSSDEETAHGLIAAHQEEQFPFHRDQHRVFGTHWTSSEDVARDFASEHQRDHAESYQDDDHDCDDHFDATPVVFHARRPERHEIETDPRRLDWQNVDAYTHAEKEVPIKHGGPVHVVGVSWLRHTGLGPIWHRHDLKQPVTLRAEDGDSPSDPDEWNSESSKQAKKAAKKPTTYYHGTAEEFQPGDFVDPSYELGGKRGKSHAFMTTDPDTALDYGEHKASVRRMFEDDVKGRAYEVEPTGPVEPDDTVHERFNAWRTRHPLKVVREITRKSGKTAAEKAQVYYHGTANEAHPNVENFETDHELRPTNGPIHLHPDEKTAWKHAIQHWRDNEETQFPRVYEVSARHLPKNVERTSDGGLKVDQKLNAHEVKYNAAHHPPIRLEDEPEHILYHGTTHHHDPDDEDFDQHEPLEHIHPSAKGGGGASFGPGVADPDYAYATQNPDTAWTYAEKRIENLGGGIPHVYRVTPHKPEDLEEDPHYQGEYNRGNYDGDMRSKSGFRVLDEVPMHRKMRETVQRQNEDDDEDWGDSHYGVKQANLGDSTDWDEHYDKLPDQVHRGFALKIPGKLYDVIHDPSVDSGVVAKEIVTRTGRRATGPHWSASHKAAQGFSLDSPRTGSSDLPIVLHAQRPRREDIETRPSMLRRREIFDHDNSEAEVPLRKGRQVIVTGVSWHPHEPHPAADEAGWIHHDFSAPMLHTAMDEDRAALVQRLREERKNRKRPTSEEARSQRAKQDDFMSSFFTPIPKEELEEQRRRAEPKSERIDDREYSINDVSKHYDWEGFDEHEISHLVHKPEHATFTHEDVPVKSLRLMGENGKARPAVSYQEIAEQDEREQERLHELERGYDQGSSIPPIVVVRHGDHHFIADGSHRAAIHAEQGHTHIPAFVTERTKFPKQASLISLASWDDDDDEYEPDECEHCGEDKNGEDHGDVHHNWLSEQKWHTSWDDDREVGAHNNGEIQRGMAMSLPKHIHDVVHDESRPMHERGKALAEHVVKSMNDGGHIGRFWTDEDSVSRNYAEGSQINYGGKDDNGTDKTPVTVHVKFPGYHHIETDPDELDYHGVYSYHIDNNREVPLQHGTPLEVKGVSWAPPRDNYRRHQSEPHEWKRHDFKEPIKAMSSKKLPVLRTLAHDATENQAIRHCPFCGSGKIIGQADGTVECEFCHQYFTVQVQPQFPNFPQTIDGMPQQVPGMPGQVETPEGAMGGGMPGMPGELPPGEEDDGNPFAEGDEAEDPMAAEEAEPEGEEAEPPPFAKKKSAVFRTVTGAVLGEDDYARHLAIRLAPDRDAMIASIRSERGAQ